MNNKVTIHFIRHTQPLIPSGICYGQLDCDVGADYASQSARLTRYFNDKQTDAIYSSPLLRCARLAQELANAHVANNVIYNNDFKEIDFGDWEGKSWDCIPRTKIEEWNENRLHFQFPNGETPNSFNIRVMRAWFKLIESVKKDEQIILVTHAGVIRSILCFYLNKAFQNTYDLSVNYASISEITLNGGTLQKLNINQLG